MQEQLSRALTLLVEKCPRLTGSCYWAGTSAIATEELHHRESYDLDFHTRKALVDVRPFLAEIQHSFPGQFQLTQPPDEYGSGFQGVLGLPGVEPLTLEVLSNYEDVPESDITQASLVKGLQRVTLTRYLADKIQCVGERAEARDLVDLDAILVSKPELETKARRILAEQDALFFIERLLTWKDEEIRRDLMAYPGVDPARALEMRSKLLSWLRELA